MNKKETEDECNAASDWLTSKGYPPAKKGLILAFVCDPFVRVWNWWKGEIK